MAKLSTHILDTMLGKPAQQVKIELFRKDNQSWLKLIEVSTNKEGRCDQPLLTEHQLELGIYQLIFHVGAYFDNQQLILPKIKFIDEVVIQFGINSKDEHYHVPLLITPWSYSTYRGS